MLPAKYPLGIIVIFFFQCMGCSHERLQSRPTEHPKDDEKRQRMKTEPPHPELLKENMLRVFGSYMSTSAALIEEIPLFVNGEFDFGTAVALPGGVGAGLAAKQRSDANLKTVADIRRNGIKPYLRATPDYFTKVHPMSSKAASVRYQYGLLFGSEKSRLTTVTALYVDKDGGRENLMNIACVSEMFKLNDRESRSAENAEGLNRAVADGCLIFEPLVEKFLTQILEKRGPTETMGECSLGDRQRIKGELIVKEGKIEIIRSAREPNTYFVCSE